MNICRRLYRRLLFVKIEKYAKFAESEAYNSTEVFGAGFQVPKEDGVYFTDGGKQTLLCGSNNPYSLTFNAALLPDVGGGYSPGSEAYMWQHVYSLETQAVITTTENLNVSGLSYEGDGSWSASDISIERDIESLSDKYSSFFDSLIPVRYKRTDGTSGRYHTGLIAQQVLGAINESGLSTGDLAAYVEDIETGLCGLRYDEFIAILINEIQSLKKQVKDLMIKSVTT